MQKVPKTTIKGKAITQLQNLQVRVVAGAAAATNIAVTGIKLGDTVVGITNLTDLTDAVIAATKAFKGAISTGFNTVIEATTAGAAGNSLSVSLVGDSTSGVTITDDGSNFVIHYKSGTSTVANVETAIAALAGAHDLIGVKTAGTGATVLTAPASDSGPKFLAGGADAYIEKPVVTSNGNVQFPTAVTTSKKIQIFFVPAAV